MGAAPVPDPFRLPRLKTLDRIVDKLGRPSLAFIKFLNTDFAGAIERQEAAQAAVDAALAATQADLAAAVVALDAEVDRLTDVLNGTTGFTGLRVGTTNVKPFLDKTDGEKLTNASGLGTAVVETTAVGVGEVTPYFSAFTTGTVNWAASSAEKDLQTVSSVVVTRGAVIIRASVGVDLDPFAGVGTTGILRLYRDGVEIAAAQVAQFLAAQIGVNYVFARQWQLDYIESPGAGTYTYKITFDPGHSATGDLRRRFLSILPLEG